MTFDNAAWLPEPAADGVDQYLQAIGKPGAPKLVRERVKLAADYLATHFPTKSTLDIVGFLKAIDFSRDVREVRLAAIAPVQSILIQYMGNRGAGNFFSKPGYAADRLGIAEGSRTFRRFRVISGSAMALVCTAAPVSDTWTQGRTLNVYSPLPGRAPGSPAGRAGELVGGGGLQIILPDPLSYYVTPVDSA